MNDVRDVRLDRNWAALRRPWLNSKRESVVTIRGDDGTLETVPSERRAVLTKEQWIAVDCAAMKQFRMMSPLVRWLTSPWRNPDSREGKELSSPLVLEIDGLPHTVWKDGGEPGVMTDKMLEMSGNRTALPLPITHSDFFMPIVEDLDTTMCEASARRVGESVEKQLIETMLKAAEHSADPLAEMKAAKFYGPYCAASFYHTPERTKTFIDKWLDDAAGVDVEFSPWMPQDTTLVFQATPDVVRMVVGMLLTVVQWDDKDGKPAFKTLCIVVPQVRRPAKGKPGVMTLEN